VGILSAAGIGWHPPNAPPVGVRATPRSHGQRIAPAAGSVGRDPPWGTG